MNFQPKRRKKSVASNHTIFLFKSMDTKTKFNPMMAGIKIKVSNLYSTSEKKLEFHSFK
jgi:hypothetical protein